LRISISEGDTFMSRRNLIIGGVVVVVVLAAIGASMGSQNEPAGTVGSPSPGAAASPVPTAAGVVPTDAPASVEPSPTGAYAVGDRVKLGDEEYFGVSEVDLDFPGTDLLKPEAGKLWIAALVEIEGINPDGATYNPFFFKVRDEEGFEYNFNAFGKDPQLQSGNELKPGQKVKGWMTFEVPATAKKFTLIYTPGFVGEPVEVALN
jgi:hypothetical protein